MSLRQEFMAFLEEFKVIPLTIAFVIGMASTALVNSFVKDIFMPILAPLFGATDWQKAMLNLGPVHIAYGSFIAELINFIILAFIVFLVIKKLLKIGAEKKV